MSITNDSGPGSLRQAIIETNLAPSADTIVFNIPKSDPNYKDHSTFWSIQPVSSMPSLSDGATIIDGTTQFKNQGFSNSHGPEIEISGKKVGFNASVFTIESNNNQIIGLSIIEAPGSGVKIISSASDNIIRDNYIGIGSYNDSLGNSIGIEIFGEGQ